MVVELHFNVYRNCYQTDAISLFLAIEVRASMLQRKSQGGIRLPETDEKESPPETSDDLNLFT